MTIVAHLAMELDDTRCLAPMMLEQGPQWHGVSEQA
jgi:hypothetical protein